MLIGKGLAAERLFQIPNLEFENLIYRRSFFLYSKLDEEAALFMQRQFITLGLLLHTGIGKLRLPLCDRHVTD